MPRRAKRYAVSAAYATNAALALVLAGALTACSGSSGSEGGEDGKAGSSSASPSAAEPGKYSTLPEPCDTVEEGMLRDMLPGAAAAEDDDGAAPSASSDPYEGRPSSTYDTDRRVGCRWKNATTVSTRHLAIDFERVVSYDPSVSDDEQAEQLYAEKAHKADVSLPPEDDGSESREPDAEASGSDAGKSPDGHASPTGKSDAGDESNKGGKGDNGDKHVKDGKDSKDSESDPSSSSGADGDGDGGDDPGEDGSESATPDENLAPRALDGVGDAAYVDDELHTAGSGVHRDITLVFRTANVIATVEYDQWVTDKHRIPDSKDLQEKARKLAEHLAEQFGD